MALSSSFIEEQNEAFAEVDAGARADRKEAPKEAAAPAATPPEKVSPVPAKEAPKTTPEVNLAPPAAKVEADPDEEIISGKRSPKSEDFKRVKTSAATAKQEADAAKAEYAKLKAEYDAAKAKPSADPAEIETLRKELATQKEQFSTVALEFVPEFNQKYQAKVDKVKGDLTALVGDKSEELFQVLAQPNSKRKSDQLSELLEDVDEITKADIFAANRELFQIQSERSSELKGSQEKLGSILQERQAKAQANQKQFEQAFDENWAALSKENPLYTPREGDEVWNNSVKERAAIAKSIYSGNFESPTQRARMAAAAASHNLLVGAVQQRDGRIAELEKQLQDMTATNPGVRGGGGGIKTESKGFAADFEAAMKGQ